MPEEILKFRLASGINIRQIDDEDIELTFYNCDIQLSRVDIAELAARFPVINA